MSVNEEIIVSYSCERVSVSYLFLLMSSLGYASLPCLASPSNCDQLCFPSWPFPMLCFSSQSLLPLTPGGKILSASEDLESLLFSQQLKGYKGPYSYIFLLLLPTACRHSSSAMVFMLLQGLFLTVLSLFLPSLRIFLFPSSLPLADTK